MVKTFLWISKHNYYATGNLGKVIGMVTGAV
jgi:hypothetical protein